jgi:hypothetical protein
MALYFQGLRVRRSKSQSSIRQSTRSNRPVCVGETAKRTHFLHRLGTALCLVPSSEPHLRKPRNLSHRRRWRTTEHSVRHRMHVRVSGLRAVTSTESQLSRRVAAVTFATSSLHLCRHRRWSAKPFDFRQPRIQVRRLEYDKRRCGELRCLGFIFPHRPEQMEPRNKAASRSNSCHAKSRAWLAAGTRFWVGHVSNLRNRPSSRRTWRSHSHPRN